MSYRHSPLSPEDASAALAAENIRRADVSQHWTEQAIISSHQTQIGPEPVAFRDELEAQLEERLAEFRRRKQS